MGSSAGSGRRGLLCKPLRSCRSRKMRWKLCMLMLLTMTSQAVREHRQLQTGPPQSAMMPGHSSCLTGIGRRSIQFCLSTSVCRVWGLDNNRHGSEAGDKGCLSPALSSSWMPSLEKCRSPVMWISGPVDAWNAVSQGTLSLRQAGTLRDPPCRVPGLALHGNVFVEARLCSLLNPRLWLMERSTLCGAGAPFARA